MLTALRENMRLATIAPLTQPRTWARDVPRHVAPSQSSRRRVDERHDRIEVGARDGTHHQDQDVQTGGGGRGVLQQLETQRIRRQRLSGDTRTDDHGGQQEAAEELGEDAASEHRMIDGALDGGVPSNRPVAGSSDVDATQSQQHAVPTSSRASRRWRARCRPPNASASGPSTHTLSCSA